MIKLSLIDYPGKLSAVIFTQGCNFRCPYCQNPDLVLPENYRPLIEEETVWDFLKRRVDRLQAVVISGGEPTLQSDLKEFIQKVKELGYLVKLDTNGSRPDMLENLLNSNLLDYIALDVKAPLAKYDLLCGVGINSSQIQKTIELLIHSKVEHEFRTTVVRSLLTEEDMQELFAIGRRAQRYHLQRFVPRQNIIDTALLDFDQYLDADIDNLQKLFNNSAS